MATQPGAAPLNANKISIVTKSEIRYEGILYHINPQDQNITLCNVKSFGTEGRRPGDEIAPSPQVHEYIIFRGTDIKDLKVLEAGPQAASNDAQPSETPKEQQTNNVQAPIEEKKENVEKDIKMNQGPNQEEFDFQGMQQKFQQVALEHKQTDIDAYAHDDFFDSLSTSTAEKTREIPFDRIAQKKTDKETFGSEYVDTATQRGRGGFRRGGGRGGGYNRGYGGGQGRGGYGGGQNRGYGGQNRNYEGGQNRNYEGGQARQYGQNRNYEGGQQRNYGQNRNYEGGQNRNYEGGQHRNYEGGQNRNYEGGQNRNYGGQNRNYGGQNRRYGGGDQDGQGGQGGNNYGGGQKYYNNKNYQNEQTFEQGDNNKDQGRTFGNN